MTARRLLLFSLALAACTTRKSDVAPSAPAAPPGQLSTGEAAKGDWTTDAPGVRRKIVPADMPAPFASDSVDNGPQIVARPAGATLHVPTGFAVDVFAEGLSTPRQLRTAPNGDVFVVESGANRVRVLRDANGDGKPEISQIFAGGLNQPFGVAFHPPRDPAWIYVANTDSVVRFPYAAGDVTARGAAEVVVGDLSPGGRLRGGGHWTRDVTFSNDGATMYVSIGSFSNDDDAPAEAERARIFAYSPDGKNRRVLATGLRNPVGLAVHPDTGELWTTVNERDGLGDHLVPDYVTRVRDGGFYGWPWFYIGANQDPRHPGAHPELASASVVPEVLVQSHSAALGMTFYTGKAFPDAYRGQAFVAFHGSWNRARRTGYKVVWMPIVGGAPTGEYVDFLTGFVVDASSVWGRPVGVTPTQDGALLVSDDGGNVVWRVGYAPR